MAPLYIYTVGLLCLLSFDIIDATREVYPFAEKKYNYRSTYIQQSTFYLRVSRSFFFFFLPSSLFFFCVCLLQQYSCLFVRAFRILMSLSHPFPPPSARSIKGPADSAVGLQDGQCRHTARGGWVGGRFRLRLRLRLTASMMMMIN